MIHEATNVPVIDIMETTFGYIPAVNDIKYYSM